MSKATHTWGPSPQGLANLLSDATPAGATSKATHTGGPSPQGLANLLSDATPAGATTVMHTRGGARHMPGSDTPATIRE